MYPTAYYDATKRARNIESVHVFSILSLPIHSTYWFTWYLLAREREGRAASCVELRDALIGNTGAMGAMSVTGAMMGAMEAMGVCKEFHWKFTGSLFWNLFVL